MADAILAQSGIYAIVNRINGRKYIGSAVCFRKRFNFHRHSLRRNQHHSQKLQNAWNKYGETCFEFTLIEIVSSKSDLIQREQHWIDLTKSSSPTGYNILAIAGSSIGRKLSAEAKKKISIAKIGHRPSEDTRARLSEANRGRPCTPEMRLKISAAHKGRVHSAQEIELRRIAKTGSKHTLETRAKMRLAHIGRKKSPETIERMKKPKSKESIAKREATKLAKRLAMLAS